MNKCLYCYKPLLPEDNSGFHSRCSKLFFAQNIPPVLPYKSSEIASLAKAVIDNSIAVPGVQPKISIGVIEDELAKGKGGRLTILDALDGHFILKPQNEKFRNMPENEHLTMKLAELLNISVVPSSLMRFESGEICYLSRRVDRSSGGEKYHMIDFLQILGLEDKYLGTMEQLGKKVGELSQRVLYDKFRFFELTVFNFLVGNNDMHLKNFSMLQDGDVWGLSPAYDLLNTKILLPKDPEDLALKLGGKKKNHNLGYFERFGEVLGLNAMQMRTVFNRIKRWLPAAENLVEASFLPDDLQATYKEVIKERIRRLGL